MEEELVNFRKMAEELKDKIECTICLEIPKKGPVPVCSNGHFICSQCLDKRNEDGLKKCATCEVPMGNSKSLLASVVIENIEHKCDFKDCGQMVHFKEYKKHQSQCNHRNVYCPGKDCSKLLSFRELFTHAKTCHGIAILNPWKPIRFGVGEEIIGRQEALVWKACSIKEHFFLKMMKYNNLYSLEVVMLGSQEDCEDFKAEISILDFKSKPVLSSSFTPRPISMEMWGNRCLSVTEKTLATIWSDSHKEKINRFEVAVNIYRKLGQGSAKKARVEESDEDSDDSDTKDDENENFTKEEENDDESEEESDDKSEDGCEKDDFDEANIEEDDIDEDDIDEENEMV